MFSVRVLIATAVLTSASLLGLIASLPSPPEPTIKHFWSGYELQISPKGEIKAVWYDIDRELKSSRLGVGAEGEVFSFHAPALVAIDQALKH